MRRTAPPLACLLLLALAPAARADAAPGTTSFRHHVMAVLARGGCNQGACHGNLNGKGGFKLSLRGEDPAADYAALTRDALDMDELSDRYSAAIQEIVEKKQKAGDVVYLDQG